MKYERIKGNLFNVDASTPLAHCISRDAKMGRGIAKVFVGTFPDIKDIVLNQNPSVGDAIMYDNGSRIVFNLVTKERYFHKPTYETLTRSLISLKNKLESEDIHAIAMPKIGSGLDKLSWTVVEQIIKSVFSDSDIHITVVELN